MFCVAGANSGVWIEFEQGNPEKPIWVRVLLGQRRRGARARPRATLPPFRAITLSDARAERSDHLRYAWPTGGIMLKSATGATLIVNDTGIYIQNGKGAMITLVGPTVTINNGALTVV